jgi:thymidylate synthase (FAD)
MKLIKPGFEILTQEADLKGVLSHIELCGRTAYKSEDKITADSAPKFVEMLTKRGHGAVLEHGTIYLIIPKDSEENIAIERNFLGRNHYTVSKLHVFAENKDLEVAYITTNYRVLAEGNALSYLKFQCGPTELHEKRVSVKFICDRGVSHEFVRHRVFSFVQESTRYCNYSKEKFGNELTFIEPIWLKDIEEKWHEFGDHQLERIDSGANYLYQLELAEETYLELLKKEWTPQQARAVLPNSLKTELIMTGSIEQWKGFFKLRCAKDAHPQARELAIPLEEEFKTLKLI